VSLNVNEFSGIHRTVEPSGQNQRDDDIDRTLKELYDWFGYDTYGADGYVTSEEENSQIDAVAGPNSCVYGEITPGGFRKLASQICLDKDDVFFDLGSGV
jgi:hypothetical protein